MMKNTARGLEAGIQRGVEQGIEQGIEQGVAQGIENTARRMLASTKYSECRNFGNHRAFHGADSDFKGIPLIFSPPSCVVSYILP